MTFDWSQLALQVVNFLVLAWLLQKFLYRPVLASIDRRRGAVLALQDAAASARAEAESAERLWRGRVLELEEEAAGRRRHAEAEGQRRAEALTAEARRQAAQILVEAREAIGTERAAASLVLQQRAAEVAATLAGRLLAVVAPGIGAAPFLGILAARLAALDAEQRALLAAGPVRLEVAPPLDAAQQEEWRRGLGGAVGALSIAEAPELIAGARLVAPMVVVEASWAEALGKARQEMVDHDDAG